MTSRRAAMQLQMHDASMTRRSPRTAPYSYVSVPSALCEGRRLREPHGPLELSACTDNCKWKFADVYSASSGKGITVERRRRKASGPRARGRRIAGLPAETSSRSSVRHPSISVSSRLSFGGAPCQAACETPARIRTEKPARRRAGKEKRRGAAQIESGKPVERRGRKASGLRDRILRQRGCHMSHGEFRDEQTCADRRIFRPHVRARNQFLTDSRRRLATTASLPGHKHVTRFWHHGCPPAAGDVA